MLLKDPDVLFHYYFIVGAPIVMSFPHYYKADPVMLETIDGLHPKRENHEFYIDIQKASI